MRISRKKFRTFFAIFVSRPSNQPIADTVDIAFKRRKQAIKIISVLGFEMSNTVITYTTNYF